MISGFTIFVIVTSSRLKSGLDIFLYEPLFTDPPQHAVDDRRIRIRHSFHELKNTTVTKVE